nr:MAG TPA: hypothetical protein [Caudoviricetes sp.]
MKYKVGDRVRIVSETAEEMNWISEMDIYLGKVMTIEDTAKSTFSRDYKMAEDAGEYYWDDSMIAGLASETPFDFDVWKGKNVRVHCKTEEEAEDFCREMELAGLRWSSGTSYLKMTCFNVYENYTCYDFNKGTYDNIVYAKVKGSQILEWSDYRSTEPKEEQEKIMEAKIDDKPLSFQEAMKIKTRICLNMRDVCEICPLSLDNNNTAKSCDVFMIGHPDMAEPILKEWMAEHPLKTNKDKLNEMLLKVFGMPYTITVLKDPKWWQQEYVKPYKVKVE